MAWVTALCFLGSQICLVLGQGFIPQVPREVPSRAGVINDSPTAGPWVTWRHRGTGGMSWFGPELSV
jgi:hypothetical protein